jgi:hypothetical protein
MPSYESERPRLRPGSFRVIPHRSACVSGNWESYANVVMNMVTADTLLDVDAKLERLNYNLGEVGKLLRQLIPSESTQIIDSES